MTASIARALIFDCDGTLADTLPAHYRAWSDTLRSLGVDLPEAWYYQHSGLSAIELVEALNVHFGYTLDPDQVNCARIPRYRALIPTVRPIESVASIVRASWQKLPMALASGGDRSIVEATLDTIQMRSYFQAIVTVSDVLQGKPAPDIFLRAAEQLNVAPAECLVYEDSDSGLEAARRAGMRSIDVRSEVLQ